MLAAAASSSAEGVAAITAGGTVFGAVVIAFIAAWTAGRRQKRQINAATAEQKRQLAHARELEDVADLRKLLDEIAIAINEAADALDEMGVEFSQRGPALPGEVRERVAEGGRKLEELDARLRVRVGDDASLTTELQAVVDAVHDGWRATGGLEEAESLSEQKQKLRDGQEAAREAGGRFIAAAVERAGTAGGVAG